MFKLKNVAASACAGFVLSFLISIVSIPTHSFFISARRGIVFAAVFALFAFAVEFVNNRFLSVETLSDSKDDAGKSSPSKTGSIVNITIDDENLTEDEAAPRFDVSENKKFFHGAESVVAPPSETDENENVPAEDSVSRQDSSVSKPKEVAEQLSEPVAQEKTDAAEFKPVPLGSDNSAHAQEIDALPDIGAFSGEQDDDGGVINDSDFAQEDSLEKLPSAPTDGKASVEQDTKTIASAIRTLLKKDEM